MRKDDINICKVYLKEANVGQNIRAGLGTLQRGLQNAVRGVGQAFNDQKTQTVLSDLVDKIVKDIKPINPNVNKTAVANALKTVVAANPAQAGGANTGGSGKRPPQAFTSNQASTTSNPPASTGGSTNPPASTGTSNPPASTGTSNPPASTGTSNPPASTGGSAPVKPEDQEDFGEPEAPYIPPPAAQSKNLQNKEDFSEGDIEDNQEPIPDGSKIYAQKNGLSDPSVAQSTYTFKGGKFFGGNKEITNPEVIKNLTATWHQQKGKKPVSESFKDFWILNLP